MSNETFVAFATQKGGIGKSTVTALAANYLHNVKGHNVAVIDCDAPQHSIHGLRERETGLIGGSWKSHATLTPLAKQDCPPLATI